jgi:membrane protein implicated in regulation of membrane protease activity
MEWLALLDPGLLIAGIALIGVLVSLPFFVAALRRLRRLKVVRGTLYLLFAGVVLLIVTAAGLVTANLYTYARLTHEQEAARVTTKQLDERRFAVTVQARGRPARYYRVQGDEWQIDARVLKWRAMGNLLGFDTVYRLERLSGRYGDVQSERSAPRTVHELAQDPGIDFWRLARRYHEYLPLADALYGSAAYVPMAEGAEYVVTVSASGLVVRPANDAARKAVGAWK